jgi:hypothetical protein
MNMIKAKKVAGLVMTFPCFVLVTIIPWEIALGAKLLSDWLYAGRSGALGAVFKVAAILIAIFLAVATLVAFIIWLIVLTRAVLGLDSTEEHTT